MTKTDHEAIVFVAWDAYKKAVGGRAFNGDPLPDWDEMANDQSKSVQAWAWRDAIKAAIMAYEELNKKNALDNVKEE